MNNYKPEYDYTPDYNTGLVSEEMGEVEQEIVNKLKRVFGPSIEIHRLSRGLDIIDDVDIQMVRHVVSLYDVDVGRDVVGDRIVIRNIP